MVSRTNQYEVNEIAETFIFTFLLLKDFMKRMKENVKTRNVKKYENLPHMM